MPLQTVLPRLDDFDVNSVGLLNGAHGQQIIDALRKLDAKDQLDTSQPHPGYNFMESWPAIVVGLWTAPGESESDAPTVNPAMYCVGKQYIGAGATADAVQLYNALDDPTEFYPATNVLELLSGTSDVQMGQPVLIMVYLDRGCANRKRYLFIADRPVAWISLTSIIPPYSAGPPAVGGGGYYNASLVTGAPLTIDPATDLIAPLSPSETVGAANQVLAMNWAEANLGDPPSHWVALTNPVFTPAWLIGYSNETPRRPVYRFYIPPPGAAVLAIRSIAGSIGGGGGGRYQASIGTGSVVGLDPTTNFHGVSSPDANQTFPATANAVWCNVFEAGSGTNGTRLVAVGATVTGTFVGMSSGALPVYYGGSQPAGDQFEVILVNSVATPGSQGNSTTAATWQYDVWLIDNSLQLATALNPDFPRPLGQMQAATRGSAYVDATGAVKLAIAYEFPIRSTCTPVSGYAQSSVGPASLAI